MLEIDGKRDSDATEITNEQNLMSNKIYSRRGQSATISKKMSIQNGLPNNRDMEHTLPKANASGGGMNVSLKAPAKQMIDSSTTFKDRPGSID